MANVKKVVKKRRERKNIEKGAVHISATFNNTIITVTDVAGNAYEGDIFVPHIDKTAGFTLSIKATKYVIEGNTDVGSSLTNNDWLGASDYVIFEGTPKFTEGSGFGPSGGEMQFSIDGGVTYQNVKDINGETVRVTTTPSGKYEVYTSAEQYYTYKFRLVTGAGVEYVYGTEYMVNKDNFTPVVSSQLTYQNGNAYAGEWTKENLRFIINAQVGPSGGVLYYGIGEDEASATWEMLTDLPKNSGQNGTYYYQLDKSISGNFYFKVESTRPNVAIVDTNVHVVKLDNTIIEATLNAVKSEGNVVINNGSWVSSETTLYPVVSTIGASGISSVFVKTNSGMGYGEYEEVTTPDYVITLSENTTSLIAYTYKILSVSGMEMETEEFVIGYDNVSPEFNYTLSGSKLPLGNLYESWYISDITVSVMMANQINAGYTIYYAYKDNVSGAEYSEWMAVEDVFTLTDGGIQGGLDRYYIFKAVSGSGLEVAKNEEYLPIDTHVYSVEINQYVGDKEGDDTHAYAEEIGEGEYHKGDSVAVSITPNDSYTIKSIKEILGESERVLFNLTYESSSSDTESLIYTIGNSNITLEVNFYKEVTLEYGMSFVDGEEQDLQLHDLYLNSQGNISIANTVVIKSELKYFLTKHMFLAAEANYFFRHTQYKYFPIAQKNIFEISFGIGGAFQRNFLFC